MWKKEKFLALVLVYVFIAFIIDAAVALTTNLKFAVWVFAIEIPIIFVVYFAAKGSSTAYFLSLLYFFVRSFNFYFPAFSFFTKNGVNIELTINYIAVNIISFAVFICFWIDFNAKKRLTDTRPIINWTITIALILVFMSAFLIPK